MIKHKIPTIIRVKLSSKINTASECTNETQIEEKAKPKKCDTKPKKTQSIKKGKNETQNNKKPKKSANAPKIKKRKPTITQMGKAIENALKVQTNNTKEKIINVSSNSVTTVTAFDSDVSLYSINGKVPVLKLHDIQKPPVKQTKGQAPKRKINTKSHKVPKKKRKILEHLSDSSESVVKETMARATSSPLSLPSLHSLGLTLSSDTDLSCNTFEKKKEQIQKTLNLMDFSVLSLIDNIIKQCEKRIDFQKCKQKYGPQPKHNNVTSMKDIQMKLGDFKVSIKNNGLRQVIVKSNDLCKENGIENETGNNKGTPSSICAQNSTIEDLRSLSFSPVVHNIEDDDGKSHNSYDNNQDERDDDLISLFTGSIESTDSLRNVLNAKKKLSTRTLEQNNHVETDKQPEVSPEKALSMNETTQPDGMNANRTATILTLKSFQNRINKSFLKHICYNEVVGICKRSNCRFKHSFTSIDLKERFSKCADSDLFQVYNIMKDLRVKYQKQVTILIDEFQNRNYAEILAEVLRDIIALVGLNNAITYHCLKSLSKINIDDRTMSTISDYGEPFYLTLLNASLTIKDPQAIIYALKAISKYLASGPKKFPSQIVLHLFDSISQMQCSAATMQDAFEIFKNCEVDIFQIVPKDKIALFVVKLTISGLSEYANLVNTYLKGESNIGVRPVIHLSQKQPVLPYSFSNNQFTVKNNIPTQPKPLESGINYDGFLQSRNVKTSIFGPAPNFKGKSFRKNVNESREKEFQMSVLPIKSRNRYKVDISRHEVKLDMCITFSVKYNDYKDLVEKENSTFAFLT